MDWETLAPILGTGLGGFVVWAMKRGVMLLIAKQKSRKEVAGEVTLAHGSPSSKSESQVLADRAGALFDDQRLFGRDLQSAVQRLSDSVEKRDRKIARLERQLTNEKRRSFSLELRLKQVQMNLDETEIKAKPKQSDGNQPG